MSSARKSRHRTLQAKVFDLGLLLLLGAILVTVGLLSGIVGMRLAVRQSEVVVPSVIGKSLEEAKTLLTERRLEGEVISERYDSSVPAGRVVAHYPGAGGSIKARRPVQLILSLGERTHPVPDLMGSTLQVARLTAAQYNYEIGHISRIVMTDADKDLVIRQDPLPGSTETASPKIHLLIGEGGGERYIMPDLTGKNLNEVEPFLTDQGFEVESIIYRFYSNVVKGTVVNHFPQPGYVVKKDDRISLEVAR